MNRKAKRAGQGFQALGGFLTAHEAELGRINQTGARSTLDDVVVKMGVLAARQDPAGIRSAESVDSEQTLRNKIRDEFMHPISKIARSKTVTAKLSADLPELRKLRVPRANMEMAGFLIAAEAMATTAEKYAPVFIEVALEPDFVAQFRAAIAGLENTVAERHRAKGDKAGATKEVEVQVSRGLGAVRILDALVKPKIAGNADLQGDWAAMLSLLSRMNLTTKQGVEATTGTTPVAGGTSAIGPTATTIPAADASSSGATTPAVHSGSAASVTDTSASSGSVTEPAVVQTA